MDVNGTRFHLLQKKREDWGECFPQGSEQTLISAWEGSGLEVDVEYVEASGALRLTPLATVFRRFARHSDEDAQFVSLKQRRGAARDRYGNTYWIDKTNTGILFQGVRADHPVEFWTSIVSQKPAPSSGTFHPVPDDPPPPLFLRGLTVTAHHYLVVGYMELKTFGDEVTPDNIQQSGVLIFDLHQNNLPDRRSWPQPAGQPGQASAYPFMPWDMSPQTDGGVYILDQVDPSKSPNPSRRFWVLDRHFRLQVNLTLTTPSPFKPAGAGRRPYQQIDQVTATGATDLTMKNSHPGSIIPVSIDSGSDGRILILDQGNGSDPVFDDQTNPNDFFPSAVLVFRENPPQSGLYEQVQRLILRVRVPDAENEQGRVVGVVGNDFVYAEAESRLYVADREGNQVIAFQVNWDSMTAHDVLLDGETDYIPLRRWGGQALIYSEGRVFYDFGERWVPAAAFNSCEFARRAVILTPTEFDPGQTFDSTILGCVWHRLFLDAEIPASTTISFRARAADDQELLPFIPWEEQPQPYLRTDGAEIPFYRHPSLPAPQDITPESPPAGTWELLFQEVHGRYLQLEITLEGTGRSTPSIYALRSWFPRFSYPEHYLPAIYREDTFHANFLDRWLANFEGLFTNLEDKIQNLPRLLDARSAPAEALDWLGKWMGLVLDPLWSETQRRFFIRHANEFYRRRGTARGLEMTLRLYLDAKLDESTFWSDNSFYRYLRIEESCIRRGLEGFDQPFRHRFVVLVPLDVTAEETAMIERIVRLEKPAHTTFQLQTYADSFVVGGALLGLDTQLGVSIRDSAGPIRLGVTRLRNGYLAPPYPLDVLDRLVMERDQLGDLPEL